jgi:hypothetical protein
MAKPWADSDFRVHVARGLSTHTLAAWTGALKGLIGLHGFGLRPADQSGDKTGQNAVDLFGLLAGSTGFMAMFARRAGVPPILSQLFASGGAEANAVKQRWEQVMNDGQAGAYFKSETRKLADELKRDQQAGMHEVQVYEKMRDRTRAILVECDKKSPGFSQKMWDAAHDATEFAMKNLAREPLRQVIPAESRDEKIGSRIGLLTHLPYQSDLVVQSQAKIGVGGGPDAYREVRDVGHVAVGTDEASLDMIAWQEAKQPGNMFELNFPLLWAARFGNAPMHMDEIRRL